jgi:hypothetical protein
MEGAEALSGLVCAPIFRLEPARVGLLPCNTRRRCERSLNRAILVDAPRLVDETGATQRGNSGEWNRPPVGLFRSLAPPIEGNQANCNSQCLVGL